MIQRISITSSLAAMVNPEPIPYSFDEKDWNTFSVNMVEEAGKTVGLISFIFFQLVLILLVLV